MMTKSTLLSLTSWVQILALLLCNVVNLVISCIKVMISTSWAIRSNKWLNTHKAHRKHLAYICCIERLSFSLLKYNQQIEL